MSYLELPVRLSAQRGYNPDRRKPCDTASEVGFIVGPSPGIVYVIVGLLFCCSLVPWFGWDYWGGRGPSSALSRVEIGPVDSGLRAGQRQS